MITRGYFVEYYRLGHFIQLHNEKGGIINWPGTDKKSIYVNFTETIVGFIDFARLLAAMSNLTADDKMVETDYSWQIHFMEQEKAAGEMEGKWFLEVEAHLKSDNSFVDIRIPLFAINETEAEKQATIAATYITADDNEFLDLYFPALDNEDYVSFTNVKILFEGDKENMEKQLNVSIPDIDYY